MGDVGGIARCWGTDRLDRECAGQEGEAAGAWYGMRKCGRSVRRGSRGPGQGHAHTAAAKFETPVHAVNHARDQRTSSRKSPNGRCWKAGDDAVATQASPGQAVPGSKDGLQHRSETDWRQESQGCSMYSTLTGGQGPADLNRARKQHALAGPAPSRCTLSQAEHQHGHTATHAQPAAKPRPEAAQLKAHAPEPMRSGPGPARA